MSNLFSQFKATGLALVRALPGIIAYYAMHLALVIIAGVALHYGWHITVPAVPVSVLTFFGSGLVGAVVKVLSKQYHLGRIEATIEKDAEAAIEKIFGPILKFIGDNSPTPPLKADGAEHDGAYL